MKGQYIHYGCGMSAPQEWLNFDCSPTLRFERLPLIGKLYTKNAQRFPENVRYGDIVKGLPVQSDSCRGIYCSHILEHLALDDFSTALQNTFKYLAPGGVFRLVVPDLEQHARKYLADASSEASYVFMRESCLGKEHRPRRLRAFLASWLGNSSHLWMWDEKSMSKQLQAHVFKDIRRAYYHDANDPMFKLVEDSGRFGECLGMQCTK